MAETLSPVSSPPHTDSLWSFTWPPVQYLELSPLGLNIQSEHFPEEINNALSLLLYGTMLRNRSSFTFSFSKGNEVNALQGKVVKKKQDLHRQCEANRAYAHYRWS